MNKNFVLAVLFSGMMFAGSVVYADETQSNSSIVADPINSQSTGNPADEKKAVASTFSFETVFNSIKAKVSDVTTHVSTHKYKYGAAVSLLVVAALIYKTYIAQNDDEDEAPTTMRSAKYNASR